jgi:hypothetical protein
MTDITYTWVISQLDCAPHENGLDDVVKTIHWRYQATDGTYTTDCYGSIGVGEVDPDDFTPYAELTKDQVIAWLETQLDVEELERNLAGQLAALANPPIISPDLPWQ